MHGIIISPMIYNVKRIYICLSDIFKLFQDFFKRNSGNHSSPHKFPHNPTLYDKTPHKEEKWSASQKLGAIMDRAMLFQIKFVFCFWESAANKTHQHTKKSFSPDKVPGVADGFLPRTFYKNSALSRLMQEGWTKFYFLSCFLTMYPANISSNSSIVPCVIRSFWHIQNLSQCGK